MIWPSIVATDRKIQSKSEHGYGMMVSLYGSCEQFRQPAHIADQIIIRTNIVRIIPIHKARIKRRDIDNER